MYILTPVLKTSRGLLLCNIVRYTFPNQAVSPKTSIYFGFSLIVEIRPLRLLQGNVCRKYYELHTTQMKDKTKKNAVFHQYGYFYKALRFFFNSYVKSVNLNFCKALSSNVL